MAYLQWNISGDTDVRDLFATGTAATATPADAAVAADGGGNRGDTTRTTAIIESILICNNHSSTSTVDLYTERWDGDGTGGTAMYILNSVVIPTGVSIAIDTPIRFNRKTDSLFAVLGNSSENITLYISYHEHKKPIS